MLFRVGMLVAGVATLALASIANIVLFDATHSSRAGKPSIDVFDSCLNVQVLRELPERISALAVYLHPASPSDDVFVGTAETGSVFWFSSAGPGEILHTIASGLGDSVKFGACEISSLALCDLNQDRNPELLAATSQVYPIGCPRLYAWSLGPHQIQLGMARPEIQSSWSHGLGIGASAHDGTPSVFSTFCGYGEIVEYRLAHETDSSGFRIDGISWRTVGQLPVSGEQALTADADNDGQTDLCIATGYSPGKAAIRIYATNPQHGIEPQPRHLIDESGRFANVRFLVGSLETDGTNEVVAWWCSDLSSGDCEMVRYRLGPEGLRERTEIVRGDADALWPRDGQMALADIDGDGNREVWFLTGSGNLWRYEPGRSSSVTKVCVIHGSGGPLAASTTAAETLPCLYFGCDRFVLRLQSRDHRQSSY